MRAFHEYDGKGNHRIGVSAKVKGDLTKDDSTKWGDWAPYTAPAVYKWTKARLFAVTDYYNGSVEFPDPKKLYVVKEAPGYDLEEIVPEGARVEDAS